MHPTRLAERIIALKDADLALRDQLIQKGQLADGYTPEMEALHIRNAIILEEIIDVTGYPTPNKVGQEASDAAWLVIQHAISLPDFLRKCAKLLAEAVAAGKSDQKSLAYLTDRIAVFEGKPQHYGTQFDWDENGELNPTHFDALALVNQRRKAIGLNPLEEQTVLIRSQAKKEKQSPPADSAERKRIYESWRKSVGWIE